jgi:hypothetical protein
MAANGLLALVFTPSDRKIKGTQSKGYQGNSDD